MLSEGSNHLCSIEGTRGDELNHILHQLFVHLLLSWYVYPLLALSRHTADLLHFSIPCSYERPSARARMSIIATPVWRFSLMGKKGTTPLRSLYGLEPNSLIFGSSKVRVYRLMKPRLCLFCRASSKDSWYTFGLQVGSICKGPTASDSLQFRETRSHSFSRLLYIYRNPDLWNQGCCPLEYKSDQNRLRL